MGNRQLQALLEANHKHNIHECAFFQLANEITLEILSYLTPAELCRSTVVCRSWQTLVEDAKLWKAHYTTLAQCFGNTVEPQQNYKESFRELSLCWVWDLEVKSRQISISLNGRCATCYSGMWNPVRARLGFVDGVWKWKIHITPGEEPTWTNTWVGVAVGEPNNKEHWAKTFAEANHMNASRTFMMHESSMFDAARTSPEFAESRDVLITLDIPALQITFEGWVGPEMKYCSQRHVLNIDKAVVNSNTRFYPCAWLTGRRWAVTIQRFQDTAQ